MGLAMEHGGAYSRAGGSPRGCWYYLRYFFLFVSLIQFLIILGLVLFMVYGNVHVSTESNLQATERRAEGLYSQVVGLTASQANLSKELNLTSRAKDTIMQLLLSTRRDLDRINASFRQCQADRVSYMNNQQYMAAIILSEKQCQEQLKGTNKSCNALLLMLNQKAKMLEMEVAKEKEVCTRDKEGLVLNKRVVEEQLMECSKAREQLLQERQLAEDRLQKVQALCLPLDKDKFETELRSLWRDSIVPRTLDTMGYNLYHPLGVDLPSIRRICDHMPTLMATKVEELARSLRAGIERVARENSDIQRQKLEVEKGLRASQEAKEKVEKEAQAREAKLQSECARQTQLALEEKAALRKERDSLAKELEEKKREAEQLKMQLAVSNSALDTCIKAKSQPMPIPRPVGPVPNPQPIDPAGLEEFKRRILESQRPPAGNAIAPPRLRRPTSQSHPQQVGV
ncbi:plasmalemma vesicle-associated protein isoform X2 [Mirounga angustirostris]|uniref:plasmalemma vesicle-associated protein isoform X1 n=1 Tax=Mirounga leonina TaxID=9715 RepID=UPI00156C3509|nr:plasmalemma vesicle-associated protein isoform X1 [Mirounga leonina]XP_045718705.1 plasmalemma vesicle-associated protein isoform X1 [Mirounga angustirostris]